MRSVDVEHLEKIPIRGRAAFDDTGGKHDTTREFAPERLRVPPRDPPGWDERMHATRTCYHAKAPPGDKRITLPAEEHPVEVQIFGVKKSADTRKALRFFSERRIKVHFVDLKQRPAAPGELRRFVQKFGIQGLIDEHSGRYADLGLRQAELSEGRWFELAVDEPMVLRMPLVRCGSLLTIGLAEADWKKWTSKSQ